MKVGSDKYKKIVFWYDKIIKLKDGERRELGSTFFVYNGLNSLEEFIASKIQSFKHFKCDVFQVAIYDVTEVLDHSYEISPGGEQLEIL